MGYNYIVKLRYLHQLKMSQQNRHKNIIVTFVALLGMVMVLRKMNFSNEVGSSSSRFLQETAG